MGEVPRGVLYSEILMISRNFDRAINDLVHEPFKLSLR